jgi:Peptidase A4 family
MSTRCRRLVALATLALAAAATPALAATSSQTSSNWAGYVTSGSGVTFRHVSATWVLPTATCPAGSRSYEASWVGLGGYHTTSAALEQIGTESDCGRSGAAVYSVWYELVPSASATIHMVVHAGDTISASVGVNGHLTHLRLTDVTRGTVFTKTVRANVIDLTSADWIVEAPSSCNNQSCSALPLANFGTEAFTKAATTTTTGLAGTIVNPGWTANAISLSTGRHGEGFHGVATTSTPTQALAGDLAATGDAFSVTYGQTTTTTPPDVTPPVETTPGT